MLSVVVVSHNEGDWLPRTVDGLAAGLPPGGEVVVVDDGSTDGSADGLDGGPVRVVRPESRLGVARARNLGASWAEGELLLFSDAHMDVPPGYAGPLTSALGRSEVGAVGPAVTDVDRPDSAGYGFRWADPSLTPEWLEGPGPRPHRVPMLGGCFVALRREVFQQVGGFDPGLLVFGLDDAELGLHLWTSGYECRVVPSVSVGHQFRAEHPYPVPWEAVIHNLLRVAVVHLSPDRVRRVVSQLSGTPSFAEAFALLAEGDAWDRRRSVREARRRDDDWFFQQFGMHW